MFFWVTITWKHLLNNYIFFKNILKKKHFSFKKRKYILQTEVFYDIVFDNAIFQTQVSKKSEIEKEILHKTFFDKMFEKKQLWVTISW